MINPGVAGLTLCHKGSDGVSIADVPDVCSTPPMQAPVPYPNIAFSRDLVKGTATVLADGGNSCANYGSEFSRSTGDEAGSAGGGKSGTFMREATWMTYSFDVKYEGKGACRLSDKMFHNHQNTANATGISQDPLVPPAALHASSTKCCGCVRSVEIRNVQFEEEGIIWKKYGHRFDLVIHIDYEAGTSGISDCTLVWEERTDVPSQRRDVPKGEWVDMYKLRSSTPSTFVDWNDSARVKCPEGGPSVVTITDRPSLASHTGPFSPRTVKRVLEFRLTVTSGAGCGCPSPATATATQVLEIKNGELISESFAAGVRHV